jgi:hypothetical protein
VETRFPHLNDLTGKAPFMLSVETRFPRFRMDPMNLDLDTQWLRTSMELWREVVEHKIPVHDNLKVHLMSRQADNLKNFIQIGQSWKTVLGSCEPTSTQDQLDYDALITQVDEFVAWAKSSLKAIEDLGTHEVAVDQAQELLSDPELGPAIRSLLDSIRKNNPRDDKGQGGAGA